MQQGWVPAKFSAFAKEITPWRGLQGSPDWHKSTTHWEMLHSASTLIAIWLLKGFQWEDWKVGPSYLQA